MDTNMGEAVAMAQRFEERTPNPDGNVAYITPSRQVAQGLSGDNATTTVAANAAAQGLRHTPLPEKATTATAGAADATVVALTTGTLTIVPQGHVSPVLRYPPFPWNLVGITPVSPQPTEIPIVASADRAELIATPVPITPATSEDFAALHGQILFLSDRSGRVETWALDPNTGALPYLVGDSRLHPLARELYLANSPDKSERAIVEADYNRALQIRIYSNLYQTTRQIMNFVGATSYNPAWSPFGDRIAFVSTVTGSDEIYTVDTHGNNLVQLTANIWAWDKHPSWAPDGSKIVFYSNRESGRKQIWMMNADGSDQRNLSNDEFENWDPIWIR